MSRVMAGARRAEAPVPADLGPPAVRVLGVPFWNLSFAEAVRAVRGMLDDGRTHQVVLANAQTLNLAHERPAYRRLLAEASLVLRDGVGVELAALLHGRRLAHNFVGTDFVPDLLGALADVEPRVFLYGAAPGVAVEAGRALERRHRAVRVVGTAAGYGNGTDVLARIQESAPDILLVALGNPRQEEWIAAHLAELPPGVAIGVGALFDYLAGRVPRAPRWMLALRLEWVFRLAVEPRRLWRRYVVGNPKFLWRVLREWARRPA
jgi:exopolysaccharide biosynthesis WecB/TagA/CpsF family protein